MSQIDTHSQFGKRLQLVYTQFEEFEQFEEHNLPPQRFLRGTADECFSGCNHGCSFVMRAKKGDVEEKGRKNISKCMSSVDRLTIQSFPYVDWRQLYTRERNIKSTSGLQLRLNNGIAVSVWTLQKQ